MRPYFISKLEEFRKIVIRHLNNGKTQNLYEYFKSSQIIDDEVNLIYKEFDRMFLNIIPDFVEEFNALLNEEDRIKTNPGELTMELRIFALIRLGIKDSSHIAKHLRYSVNTIYNYRSRLKNRSKIPRDDFEDEVMKIGSLSGEVIF